MFKEKLTAGFLFLKKIEDERISDTKYWLPFKAL